ncbi:MAG: 1,4-alpha-glucan branching protein GlgB [Gammaproteobacteria bacterium]|nr:1,4-alpha-glucan branching protein GlgB [Gammaproteobacteria bacterium]
MTDNAPTQAIPSDIQKIIDARHHEPFSVLGQHGQGKSTVIRAFIPGAAEVFIDGCDEPMQRRYQSDIFEWCGPSSSIKKHYQLRWDNGHGHISSHYDPYCFDPQLSDYDLHLFGEGKHWHVYRVLGSHNHSVGEIDGVLFATWAPNAERVSIVGDFNGWDGRRHPMRNRGGCGVWELFIPGIQAKALYKYEIRSRNDGALHLKADPYAQQFELRPGTAAVVTHKTKHLWHDEQWMTKRANSEWLHEAMSIYEVHLGSWQRDEHGNFLNYRELANRLVNYVAELGFTHIELLPITEHPLDASWGYQTTGYYAATSRFGSGDDLRYFIDCCHQNNIGVILDWVPAHFPKDAHGLGNFDGTALYEHEDPRLGEHTDWGTLIFNYGRNEVKNFLLSSAIYWLEEYHIDGLRVDAVASMLYLDYSRKEGEWLPNKYGGRENLDVIDFLRELNSICHDQHPGVVIAAEESTSWPMVSRPTWVGGLGFSMKWNMGWMNDTLEYMSQDPVYRQYNQDLLTFSQLYAYTENFILPFSHDEVVHLKKSLINKMPGDEWQRFANLRLLYSYMFTHPGKKLLFMGCEFAQGEEWNSEASLDWYTLNYPNHRGVQSLVKDLNRLYRNNSALHHYDFDAQGFEWIDCHDSAQSILSYMRKSDDDTVIVALNFTPIPRHNYRIGVPYNCHYKEIFNSDSEYYGGSNIGNSEGLKSDQLSWMGKPYSLTVTLPPLACVILKPV